MTETYPREMRIVMRIYLVLKTFSKERRRDGGIGKVTDNLTHNQGTKPT
jgi:hypothetical protein